MTSIPRKRVLVIEDYEPVAEIESLLVTMEGYDVRVARTSDAGMAALAESPPDLVVLDLMLPGSLTGEEVLRAILADRESTSKVLVVSALINPEMTSRLEAHERVHTLAKPFRVKELGERIRSLMEG